MSDDFQATGTLTIPGMGYGDVDWKSMIDTYVQAQQVTLERLAKWKADWKLRQDAFYTIKTELVTLKTELAKINTTDKFLVKSASSSNSGVASATLGSNAIKGDYSINVQQVASKSTSSINTGIKSKFDVITEDGVAGELVYSFQGEERSITIPAGTTLEGLKNIINNNPTANKEIAASLVDSGNGFILQIDSKETGSNQTLAIKSVTGVPSLASKPISLGAPSTHVVNTSSDNEIFSWSEGDQLKTITVPPGTTVDGLKDLINTRAGYQLADYDVTGDLTLTPQDATKPFTIIKTGSSATNLSNLATPSNTGWSSRSGQDAHYTINGWPEEPDYFTSTSNKLEVATGVTINIKGKGTTAINIDLDTEKITENVQSFVDSVNKVRTTFKDLTKYDDTKAVVDVKYAESQFDMERGSVLTGNYGAQMLESTLKQAVSSLGLGFLAQSPEGSPNGDLYSSLAHIGIVTNSDEGSENFGLLEIKESSNDSSSLWSHSSFGEALEKDPEGVALLFSASNENSTTRSIPDFSVTTKGKATNGTYDVSYSLDADGNIIDDDSLTINGVKAILGSDGKTITAASTLADGSASLADGATIYVDTKSNKRASGLYSASLIIDGYEVEHKKGDVITKEWVDKSYGVSATTITYNSSAPLTKAGTYDVTYSVVADASQPSGVKVTGFINGKEAVYVNGVFKMADVGVADDANGIELTVSDLSLGNHVAQVSIKQGKVNQLLSVLNGRGTQNDPGMLDSKYGTLAILISNYQEIMDNAQLKMEKEEKRIEAFKARLTNTFSRLEEKLTKLNGTSKTLEQQVKKLSSNDT